MSELYDLENLTLREIKALRTGLDHLPINGIDAFFVGTLQIKLNEQIKNCINIFRFTIQWIF